MRNREECPKGLLPYIDYDVVFAIDSRDSPGISVLARKRKKIKKYVQCVECEECDQLTLV